MIQRTPRLRRPTPIQSPSLLAAASWRRGVVGLAVAASLPATAHAALLSGEALDTAADIMAWVVLVIAPVVAIGVFLLVHILPEKIAEKKHHPQAKAIQCLCLLSLAFGGLLWPMAWLWAYTKPVLYKQAYGTDKVVPGEEGAPAPGMATHDAAVEIKALRARLAELEAKLGSQSTAEAAGA